MAKTVLLIEDEVNIIEALASSYPVTDGMW